MNIKPAVITAIVRLLSDNTNLIPRQTPFEEFLNAIGGGETAEQRFARQIETAVDQAVGATVRLRARKNRFKKVRIIEVSDHKK